MAGSLKTVLRGAFSWVPFPVLRGPLRGFLWVLGSGGKRGRIIMSTYEPASSECLRQLIRPGDTVFDIGAHVGYYTLLASTAAEPEGTVVAFEPEPQNVHFRRRHIRWNRRRNVQVEELALGERTATVRFQPQGSGTGHLAEDGDITVRMTSLDDYAAATGCEPDVMKIDVEGAEAALLEGAREVLATARPQMLLSTHGPQVDERCRRLLDAAGYDVQTLVETDAGGGSELLCLPRP
ncbi:MAG: FkbM family methyltransferase [Armatimonadota bacterium]|nr:FkbM family methyltransferase [Armatimonadota bacterium]